MNNIKLLNVTKPVLSRLVSGVALWVALFTQPVLANNIQDQINGLTLHSTRIIYPHDAKNGVTYTTPIIRRYRIYCRRASCRGKEFIKQNGEREYRSRR
ncbi:hypothetical protein M5X66_00525 [Providencia sp. PROV188]|uniref:hypothetical protein n=1 Tax=Providencia sp. PROV188 TaxID=2939731 RepID=UPI0022DE9501|nr:hypothetical protein M5X66_00525 [Providencia sp. PROV188]